MDKWIPSNVNTGYTYGTEQVLYAVLGPSLSHELADLVRRSDKTSDDLRQLAERLEERVGRPPEQLFYMAITLGRLRHWLEAQHGSATTGRPPRVIITKRYSEELAGMHSRCSVAPSWICTDGSASTSRP